MASVFLDAKWILQNDHLEKGGTFNSGLAKKKIIFHPDHALTNERVLMMIELNELKFHIPSLPNLY